MIVHVLKFSLIILAGSSLALARSNPVMDDFNNLHAALKMYKMTTGTELPVSDGFQALVSRPTSLTPDKKWEQISKTTPTDPWGNPYRYVAGDGYPNGYGIYSTGMDGKSKTQGNDPDDWNSWSEDHRGMQPNLKQYIPYMFISFCIVSLISYRAGMIARNRKKQIINDHRNSA